MKKRKIVVADDEKMIIELYQELLAGNYSVYPAVNGLEAVMLTQKEKPDLVVMDIVMPGIDGYEACRRIKMDSQTGKIPVLMISAKGQFEDTIKGFNSGADSYIVKPFITNNLLKKIDEMIRRSELMEGLQEG